MPEKSTQKPTNYLDIFQSIINTPNKDAAVVTKDIKNSKNTEHDNPIKAREKVYTMLTEDFEQNYKKTHQQKRNLKNVFFYLIMIPYVVVVCGSVTAIIIALFLDGNHIDVVLGSAASLITSIIAIPTIIAKYLFPTGEDQDMTTMINKMQDYDNGIRKFENGENKEKQTEQVDK